MRLLFEFELHGCLFCLSYWNSLFVGREVPSLPTLRCFLDKVSSAGTATSVRAATK